jgi:uncharacterized protein YdaU (DUF1376 family)
MRTSTRTPRLSWFKCFPADFVSNSVFLSMSALARGVYWSLILFSWNGLCQGNGLPADPESLQRISGITALEWDSIKTQVLTLFELRDGMLYLPWLVDAAADASEKWHKQKDAAEKATEARAAQKSSAPAAEKENENSPRIKTDEIDEMRLDKNGRPYGQVFDTIGRPNGHPSASSSDINAGISPLHGSPTSGRLAAPASGVPLPSASKAPQEMLNTDIVRVREAALQICGKLPNPTDIARLLDKGYSADEMIEAFDNYANDGEYRDLAFAEFNFFGQNGSGGEVVMNARRKEAVGKKRCVAPRNLLGE